MIKASITYNALFYCIIFVVLMLRITLSPDAQTQLCGVDASV